MTRLSLMIFGLVMLAGCAVQTQPPAASAHRPNILFILADDQRFDTIHALGNKEIYTPNLDRLVERGFTFTNTYCQGGMVAAVCLPSRTMLMTGRSVFRIPGVNPKDCIAPNIG